MTDKAGICLLVMKSAKGASALFFLCKFLKGLLLPFTAYAYQRLIRPIYLGIVDKLPLKT